MSFTNCKFINNTVINNYTYNNVNNNQSVTAGSGGAIYNVGNLFIENSIFMDNSANINVITNNVSGNLTLGGAHGGAIYTTGKTKINNTKFSNSTANFNIIINNFTGTLSGSRNTGGTIWNSASNININNSNFTSSSAGGSGGVIYNTGSNVTVINSNFTSSSAGGGDGGVIYNTGFNLSVINSNFTSSSAGGSGGVIYNAGGSNLSVINSNFTSSSAVGNGGVIWNSITNWNSAIHANNVTVINSNFTSSSAGGSGGVIYNTGSNGTFSDNIFGNSSAGTGGGVIYNTGSNVSVINSNFTSSSAGGSGGVIYNAGGMLVSNNTMFGNIATNGSMIFNGGNMGVLNITYLNNMTHYISGNSFVLYALLVDDMGNTVSGGRVYFYVNGTLVGSTVSDSNGTARVSFTIPTSMRPLFGQPNNIVLVNGTYSGHTGYSIDMYSGELEIPYNDKIPTKTTINVPSNIKPGQNITISGVATDGYGNPLANIVLYIINGHNFTVTNNSTGGWSYTFIYNNAGDYNIFVSWDGNSTHFDFINSTNIVVNQLQANSTINISSNTRIGQNINITGIATDENGNPLINTTLIITIGNNEYVVVTNSTGGWSILYTPDTTGNVIIRVNLTDSINYVDFTNSTNFNVGKIITNSSINAPNGKIGQQSTITGVAKDENGNPLANVQLTVVINGSSYSVNTSSAGAWSLNITPSVSGSLNVQVTWTGNATHNAFTNTTIFNVVNAGSNSTINAPSGKIGQQSTITGVATGENGNPLANVQITVVVNGTSYNVNTNSTGAWSLNITPSVSGSLSVVVSWTGNATHNGFTNTTTFNVANASTNSTINTPNGKIGQQSTISGVAKDENGNPLANVQITVVVNGTSYNVNTNSTGAWSLNITPSVSGSLSVVVSWTGNATHNGFTNSTTFNVANANTNSTIVVPSGKAGQSMNITGIALDENGNPLVNINLTVIINGTVYTVTTDSSGVWILSYTPIGEALFDLSVSWTGNSTHNGFTNSTVFSVPKIQANTTIDAPNSKVGKKSNITGIALDNEGNPLANIQITVIVDGVSYNVTTDSTGAWSLNYAPINAGILNVVVTWAGNNTHNGFTNTSTFSVDKLNTIGTISADNATVGKPTNITGIATDEDGNPLVNAQITVTIDGKNYNVSTNSAGKWSLTYIPKQIGNIRITVTWAGNSTHSGFTNTKTFNVAKSTPKEKNPIKITLKKKGNKITATLTDKDGNPLANKKITLRDSKGRVLGIGITNKNGQVTFIIKQNGIKVTATFAGDDNYLGSTASITIQSEAQTNNNTNNNNNPVSAKMQNTGMPIVAIILVLLSMIGVIYRKR